MVMTQRTKGQTVEKQALIRAEVFISHQLVLQKIHVIDGREGIKRYKGAPQQKDALGGSDLGGASGGHFGPINVLDLLLMPYRVETMNPLAQVMSPKHKTSWEVINTVYSKSVSLS